MLKHSQDNHTSLPAAMEAIAQFNWQRAVMEINSGVEVTDDSQTKLRELKQNAEGLAAPFNRVFNSIGLCIQLYEPKTEMVPPSREVQRLVNSPDARYLEQLDAILPPLPSAAGERDKAEAQERRDRMAKLLQPKLCYSGRLALEIDIIDQEQLMRHLKTIPERPSGTEKEFLSQILNLVEGRITSYAFNPSVETTFRYMALAPSISHELTRCGVRSLELDRIVHAIDNRYLPQYLAVAKSGVLLFPTTSLSHCSRWHELPLTRGSPEGVSEFGRRWRNAIEALEALSECPKAQEVASTIRQVFRESLELSLGRCRSVRSSYTRDIVGYLERYLDRIQ